MEDCKVVIFKINNEEYAIDIMEVERILGYVKPTQIPDSPRFVKGIINYQDDILPIIDTKSRFNLANMDYSKESKIIVVKIEDSYIGLCVDMVLEVIDISEASMLITPEISKREDNKYLKGIINKDSRIILFLDTNLIIEKSDIESVQSIC